MRGSGEREQPRNRGNEAALAEGLAAGGAQDHATITGESSSHANTACTDYKRQLGSSTDLRVPHSHFAGEVFGMPNNMTKLLDEVLGDVSALPDDNGRFLIQRASLARTVEGVKAVTPRLTIRTQ